MQFLLVEVRNFFGIEATGAGINGDSFAAAGTATRLGVGCPGHRLHLAQHGRSPIERAATHGIIDEEMRVRMMPVLVHDRDVGSAASEAPHELAGHLP